MIDVFEGAFERFDRDSKIEILVDGDAGRRELAVSEAFIVCPGRFFSEGTDKRGRLVVVVGAMSHRPIKCGGLGRCWVWMRGVGLHTKLRLHR